MGINNVYPRWRRFLYAEASPCKTRRRGKNKTLELLRRLKEKSKKKV